MYFELGFFVFVDDEKCRVLDFPSPKWIVTFPKIVEVTLNVVGFPAVGLLDMGEIVTLPEYLVLLPL